MAKKISKTEKYFDVPIEEIPQKFRKLKKEILLIDKETTRLYNLLINPYRKKIIFEILNKQKRPLNITEIWFRSGGKKSISYKSLYVNVQKLKDAGLIKLTKKQNLSGRAVMVERIESSMDVTIERLIRMKTRIDDIILI